MSELQLPPEPGTNGDDELGIPGPPEALADDDPQHDAEVDQEPSYDHDHDDDKDELDGEVDPDVREDGLDEPEDDS